MAEVEVSGFKMIIIPKYYTVTKLSVAQKAKISGGLFMFFFGFIISAH